MIINDNIIIIINIQNRYPRLLSNMFAFRISFQRSSIIVQLHPEFQLAVQAVVYYII